MRNKDKLFNRGHHNIIAARIREAIIENNPNKDYVLPLTKEELQEIRDSLIARNVLVTLAISTAHRFKEDNQSFDPRAWLDQCSPDPQKYPFSELWED